MNQYLSKKLKVISFILICLVVLLHSQIVFHSPEGISTFIQQLFSENVTRVAVPSFFLLSGYLFAINLDNSNLKRNFGNKIKKRFKSLAVPYLLWSLFCFLFVGCIQLVIPIKPNHLYFNLSFAEIIKEFFIYPTIAYQLWFIRDLFIMALISPVLYLGIRYLRWVFLLLIFYVVFFVSSPPVISSSSIAFFSLGLYIATYHKSWLNFRFHSKLWFIVPLLWLGFCFANQTFHLAGTWPFFLNVGLGAISIWSLYDLIGTPNQKRLWDSAIISLSFFIYLTHEPILTLIKYSYIYFIGVDSIFNSLLLFFITPILAILICWGLATFLQKEFPNFFGILTGGR